MNTVDLTKINSTFIGVFFSLTSVASIISAIVSIPSVSVVLSASILLAALFVNRRICIQKKAIVAYALLLCILFFSILLNGYDNVSRYILFYMAFATTALILSSLKINYEFVLKVILAINIVYLVVFFCFSRNAFLSSDRYGVAQMGVAYSFVPFVLINSVSVIELIKKKSRYIFLLLPCILLIGNLYVILIYTITRGAILAIAIGILLLVYLNSNQKVRRSLIIILIGLSILFIFLFGDFLDWFFNNLQNTSVGAIKKLILFAESGKVSNGRDELYESAYNVIKDSFLVGRGVGFFEKHNDSLYVHQIFLQALCEFGLIGTLLFLLPLFRYFIKLVSLPVNEYRNIYVAFFCSVIVMLIFSNVYWLVPNFWLIYFLTWNSKDSVDKYKYLK